MTKACPRSHMTFIFLQGFQFLRVQVAIVTDKQQQLIKIIYFLFSRRFKKRAVGKAKYTNRDKRSLFSLLEKRLPYIGFKAEDKKRIN